jgi:hypothetical protein
MIGAAGVVSPPRRGRETEAAPSRVFIGLPGARKCLLCNGNTYTSRCMESPQFSNGDLICGKKRARIVAADRH